MLVNQTKIKLLENLILSESSFCSGTLTNTTCIRYWKYTISGTLLGTILYINMSVCNSLWIIINSTHDCPCSVYTPHYEQKQSTVIYVLHAVQVTVHLSPLNKRSKQNASWNQQRVITSHPSTFTRISGLLNVSFVVISSLSIACVISQTLKNCPENLKC